MRLIVMASVRSAGPRALPSGARRAGVVVAAARSTILAAEEQDAAIAAARLCDRRATRSPDHASRSPRFRPFETALDRETALRAAARSHRRRRRRRALPRAPARRSRWSSTTAGSERRATTPPRASACAPCAARPPATPIRPRSREAALTRAVETARLAVGAGGGTLAAAPRPTNQRLYTDRDPFDDAAFAVKVEMLREIDAFVRGLDPRVVQVSRQPRGLDAGGGDPAPRGRPPRRGAADGAAQHLGHRRGERPARIGLRRRRRPPRPRAAHGHRPLAGGRPRGAADRHRQPPGRAGARRGHGRRARARLAGDPAARGDRPRARGRLQPQADLGLRRPHRHPHRRARA